MVILLAPVLICVLAAILVFAGVALVPALIVAVVIGVAAMWLLIRGYRRAKERAAGQSAR